MSKVNDKDQDEVRPESPAIDDIPFAIEVNVDEEVAEAVESNDEEASVAETADTTVVVPVPTAPSKSRTRNASRSKASTESTLSLREILFGDFLLGTFLRRQIGFILFLVLLGIFYISNRYAAQQEIIEEETLRKELVEKKNYALTQYAELTMASRQSGLEQRLRAFGDSLLTTSNEPPFVIQVKE